MHELPSPETLRQLLDYDPDTGILTWRYIPKDFLPSTGIRSSDYLSRRHNTRWAGKVAGHKGVDGYVRIRVGGRSYKAHRIVWMMAYGPPNGVIDHINGNPSDNRLSNLRDVDTAINSRNRSITSTSNTGFRGIYNSGSAFVAHACVNRKTHYLGSYRTIDEAIDARRRFDEKHGFLNR